jgi:hypothetical protein
MDKNTKEALKLLKVYAGGHYSIWKLSGRHKASCRSHIMAVLLGVKKVPQAKAGVTAIRAEFYKRLEITSDHEAGREKKFEAIAQAV